jgi:SAM-dependent methyltransferase
MIPTFLIESRDSDSPETREQGLARQMGRPPWDCRRISPSLKVGQFVRSHGSSLVAMIFDAEFWYSSSCWRRWAAALLEDGHDGKINVPLGNQEESWRHGLEAPVYLTVRGLERASTFVGARRWVVKRATRPECFCVAVVPLSVLRAVPEEIGLGELARYWTERREEVRIFCEGWLHSFSAIRDAGRRHDLISMCDWQGTVLELGCGCGLMARTCKEMGFDVYWVGVDIRTPELVQARSWLDAAVKADIGRALPLSTRVRFDRVVCGDFLEHLPYPWELLSQLGQLLKPGGLLVASFPNVGHWSVVEDLLAGRWDEAPSGIFCVSHLRFGTRMSWERWFQESGWHITRWEEETLPPPEDWMVSPLLSSGVCDFRSLETLRYRVVARRA